MYNRKKTYKLALTILMLLLVLLMIFPFVLMFTSSMKPLNEIYLYPPKIWSENASLESYRKVLFEQNPPFWSYIVNTTIVTVVSVAGTLLTASLGGYAFAKMKFKGRNVLFLLYLATMMVPNQSLMVPQFILFKHLGIFNTLWALILPRLFTPLGTFLMRQYFLDIPDEIIEAGRIDGAGDFRIFSTLVLPLAKPALSTVAILHFVWRWNDYEAPLIFISDKKYYTLTVGLTNFIDESGFALENMVMAGATIATIPILLVYLLGQNYIIEGITAGSVKG
ncbi:carbohydrate ABC transporter permease [Ruthenibacterium lactatiformans]|uniref:carbohydrate ABC transporter permease n=1 Tax=Ruthenibacterium lactatiformans TaxID=1550024 RepID=UPI0026DAD7E6|nr:carbohydrate ABC transporter permease [Ruthenibacterium lactatiformans]